jgi:hypothetical protein
MLNVITTPTGETKVVLAPDLSEEQIRQVKNSLAPAAYAKVTQPSVAGERRPLSAQEIQVASDPMIRRSMQFCLVDKFDVHTDANRNFEINFRIDYENNGTTAILDSNTHAILVPKGRAFIFGQPEPAKSFEQRNNQFLPASIKQESTRVLINEVACISSDIQNGRSPISIMCQASAMNALLKTSR